MRRKPIPFYIWWWGTLLFMLVMIAFMATATSCKMSETPTRPAKHGWITRGSAVPWADKPPSICDWIPEGR